MNDCPNCHSPQQVAGRFCRTCGYKQLPSAAQPAQAQRPTSPPPPQSAARAQRAQPHEFPRLRPAAKRPNPIAVTQEELAHLTQKSPAFSSRPTEFDLPSQQSFPTSVQQPYSGQQAVERQSAAEPQAKQEQQQPLILPDPLLRATARLTPDEARSQAEGLTEEVPVEGLKEQTRTLATLQENPERIYATKRAAEHWRHSWIERQRQEAGPATHVARGQAEVQEPLNAMRQSLARLRAIIIQENQAAPPKSNLGYLMQVGLLSGLILALAGFILATYI